VLPTRPLDLVTSAGETDYEAARLSSPSILGLDTDVLDGEYEFEDCYPSSWTDLSPMYLDRTKLGFLFSLPVSRIGTICSSKPYR